MIKKFMVSLVAVSLLVGSSASIAHPQSYLLKGFEYSKTDQGRVNKIIIDRRGVEVRIDFNIEPEDVEMYKYFGYHFDADTQNLMIFDNGQLIEWIDLYE